jgi:hypothetical protein
MIESNDLTDGWPRQTPALEQLAVLDLGKGLGASGEIVDGRRDRQPPAPARFPSLRVRRPPVPSGPRERPGDRRFVTAAQRRVPTGRGPVNVTTTRGPLLATAAPPSGGGRPRHRCHGAAAWSASRSRPGRPPWRPARAGCQEGRTSSPSVQTTRLGATTQGHPRPLWMMGQQPDPMWKPCWARCPPRTCQPPSFEVVRRGAGISRLAF